MKKLKLLLVFSLVLFFVKWLGPKRTEYITFDSVFIEQGGYVVRVGLYGEFQSDKHFLFKIVTRASPYMLHVTGIYQNEDDFSSIRVLETSILGLDDGKLLQMSEPDFLRKDFELFHDSEGYKLSVSFKNLYIPPQEYRVGAEIEVCREAKCYVDSVSAILNYTIEYEYSLSFIDGLMSV